VEVFHEGVRDVLGAYPGAFLYEWTIEGEYFFDFHRDVVVDLGTIKVGEYEEGVALLFGDDRLHGDEQQLHLRRVRMGIIEQQNLLALVLDEMYAVVHRIKINKSKSKS